MPLTQNLLDLTEIRDRLQALRDGTLAAIRPDEAHDLQLRLQSILRRRYLLPSPSKVDRDDSSLSAVTETTQDQEEDRLAFVEQKMDLLMDDIVPLFFEYWVKVGIYSLREREREGGVSFCNVDGGPRALP